MKTSTTTKALRAAGAAALLAGALGLTTLQATPAAAAVDTNGGFADAYGLSIDTTILAGNIPVVLGPEAQASNSCAPQKAPSTNQVLGLGDPQLALAEVATTGASSVCTGAGAPKSMARAQLANVDALEIAGGPGTLAVDAITTTSSTDCVSAPSGSTQVVGLTLGGTPIVPDGLVPPNTTVVSPVLSALGITIILNEQTPAANGRGLVVNGIHIIADNSGVLPIGGTVIRGDIVISHAVSGVVCANGKGSEAPEGVDPSDITFAKSASPEIAPPGTTVTYTAKVTNTSEQDCEVLRFIEHLSPAVEFVSTAGPLGTAVDTPLPTRPDGGQEAVIRPTDVTIAAKASVTQTFVVKVRPDAAPGVYYNNLEIFCGPNGNFVSGPIAPITVPANVPVVPPVVPELPRTGGAPLLALGALGALGAAFGIRRFAASR